MSLEISGMHTRLLFQAIEDAAECAREAGIDLKNCHIEILDSEIYQGREMHAVLFFAPLNDANDADDICVYIDKETGKTAFVARNA